jgi:uncharacterized protein (TIGR02246 family)
MMRICVALVAVCALACSTAVRTAAQCKPAVEGQIAEVRNSWEKNWNAKLLDNVVKLYAADAAFLPADGSRASGQNKIRASLQKQIGSKVSVTSVTVDCSDDVAYDGGTYKQDWTGGISGGVTISGGVSMTGMGKHIEGNYLVVLKRASGKWLIVQHASTAKP